MANLNGMGPMNAGPGTGRRMGRCFNNGQGMGYGRGMFNARGRGYGFGLGFAYGGTPPTPEVNNNPDFLKSQKDFFENRIKEIDEQLNNL